MKNIGQKTDNKITFEPLTRNRYVLSFTNGLEIEPVRIQQISLDHTNHYIKIIEIVGQVNIFKTTKIGMKVSYQIDFLDPAGKTVETLTYKGKIKNTYLDVLRYSDDNLLTTELEIEILENID